MAQHTHDVYDTGKCFEINGLSRFIKETSSTKLVLVKGDHKSEVITFQLPRFIDGHDMLLCNKIRVHYINIETSTNNKSADLYEVTDLKLCEECEDVLTFTWTIEAPATKYYGSLAFLIKFECTDGDSILYQWNTARYVGVNVLDGMDNSEEFVEKYSNVLEEWYNELTRGADTIEELNRQALAEIKKAKETARDEVLGVVDKTYNPESENAQSGKAVEETVAPIRTAVANKQEKLVDGQTIKTINGKSVLGSGNIIITGEGDSISIDSEYNPNSDNAQSGKAVAQAIRSLSTIEIVTWGEDD